MSIDTHFNRLGNIIEFHQRIRTHVGLELVFDFGIHCPEIGADSVRGFPFVFVFDDDVEGGLLASRADTELSLDLADAEVAFVAAESGRRVVLVEMFEVLRCELLSGDGAAELLDEAVMVAGDFGGLEAGEFVGFDGVCETREGGAGNETVPV